MATPVLQYSALRACIGVSRVDITPPIGIYARNWGAALHDVASSIHRPLTLTALTIASIDSGEAPIVLIDADLGWWKTPQAFERVQHELLARHQLAANRFGFALSHTHAGPPLMEPDHTLPGSDFIAAWMDRIISGASYAIGSALATATESLLEWHTGRCNLAAYRDLPDPDTSRARILCGYNPTGSGDDTLVVGRLSDLAGRPRATIVNYACHPTTLAWDNQSISPDFLGSMRQTMQDVTGVPALFLQGASGELAPRHQYVGDTSIADRHGRQLAYASLATLEDMEPPGYELQYDRTVESGAPLAVWSPELRNSIDRQLTTAVASVELALKNWPTADELETERRATSDRALEERLRRKRDIRRALGDGSTYQLPIVAWRLGEAALIGSCCEAYSIYQTELRRRFPDRTLICMNLINGSMGYLPPRELYDLDIYQAWQTPFDRGSFELYLEASSQALEKLFAR